MLAAVSVGFGLILSCVAQTHFAVPTLILRLDQERYVEPNYNFAYDISDLNTGDVKTQTESRKGDSVFGQYTLIQPDGIKRIVDYKADDKNGFTATVNNEVKREMDKTESNNENNGNGNANGNENVLRKINAETVREFLEQQSKLNPVAQPTLTLSRSQIFQNVPDLAQPYIATILHR